MQIIDYIILLAYLCTILLIGMHLSRRPAAGDDFFLAGRSMHWFPVGLSVMTTAFNAINYTAFSGEVFGRPIYPAVPACFRRGFAAGHPGDHALLPSRRGLQCL